ncbi:MAG TPA: GNAT family protein [Tabrizicola sp.]|nr:GNAT family protein [Tabrizicola sp.]
MPGPAIEVRLRSPLPADAKARAELGVSAGIVRMYGALAESRPRLPLRLATRWLKGLQRHPCAWVIEADGALAGEARLDNINRDDLRARLAIGLFNDRHLGLGIGRRAVRLVLDHAFNQLALHRVDLRVLASNHRAIRCYQACGFVQEGVERQSARVGDDWEDDWIMAILSHEYRALDQR